MRAVGVMYEYEESDQSDICVIYRSLATATAMEISCV